MVEHTYDEQGDYRSPTPNADIWDDEFETRDEEPVQHVLNEGPEVPEKHPLDALFVGEYAVYSDNGPERGPATNDKRMLADGGSELDSEDDGEVQGVYAEDDRILEDTDRAFDKERKLRRQLGERLDASTNRV